MYVYEYKIFCLYIVIPSNPCKRTRQVIHSDCATSIWNSRLVCVVARRVVFVSRP